MKPQRRRVLLALAALALSGCAGLRPGFEEPSVTLSSFRMLPTEGLMPRFAIGLRVVNPNNVALDLRGLSYDIELEGQKLLTGVAGELSSVPAYAESDIEVQSGVDLISGMRLINQLLSEPQRERFSYALRARLDVGGRLRPILIEDRGEITLSRQGQTPGF